MAAWKDDGSLLAIPSGSEIWQYHQILLFMYKTDTVVVCKYYIHLHICTAFLKHKCNYTENINERYIHIYIYIYILQ